MCDRAFLSFVWSIKKLRKFRCNLSEFFEIYFSNCRNQCRQKKPARAAACCCHSSKILWIGGLLSSRARRWFGHEFVNQVKELVFAFNRQFGVSKNWIKKKKTILGRSIIWYVSIEYNFDVMSSIVFLWYHISDESEFISWNESK